MVKSFLCLKMEWFQAFLFTTAGIYSGEKVFYKIWSVFKHFLLMLGFTIEVKIFILTFENSLKINLFG